MKCFYEVLEVPRNVSFDDLKKSYKKLALKWHPDKNPDNVEESKERFQLIQQAYEVLSDPRERQWYDNHRDYIINSGDTPVDELNLFKYFSPSCYKGFGDDEKGFYTVYREVFNTIFIEECYYDGEPEVIPTFGRSDSDFAEIVRPFYNYWCGFNTNKPFGWLDEYDIRKAPNRRVAKLMEKENKKIRDKAKKERNEEIQALIEFVRKRDKRVKAYAETLKLKSAENNKRMEEARRIRLKEKQKDMANYKETEWSKFSNVEAELKVIENSLIAQYGSSDELESNDETENFLYCVACNKVFKTEKAFQNHEKSKKHKDNIELIKVEMLDEEEFLNNKESVEINNASGDNVENNTEIDTDNNGENYFNVESSIDKTNFDGSNSNKESFSSSSNETDELISNNSMNTNLKNETDSDDILEAHLSSEEETNNTQKKSKKKKNALSIDKVNELYCLPCDQLFRTEKALCNHKTSKKHNDKVVLLSAKCVNDDDDHKPVCETTVNDLVTEVDTKEVPKKNELQKEAVIEKSAKKQNKSKLKRSNHACRVCSSVFSSKDKLQQHIKDTNHEVLKTVVVKESRHKKKGK